MRGKWYIYRHTECQETWGTCKNFQHYSTECRFAVLLLIKSINIFLALENSQFSKFYVKINLLPYLESTAPPYQIRAVSDVGIHNCPLFLEPHETQIQFCEKKAEPFIVEAVGINCYHYAIAG